MRKYAISDECIYCGACETACPEAAIADDLEAGAYVIDPARCTGCPGSDPPPCVAACPVDAVVAREVAPAPTLQMLRFRGVLRSAKGTSRLLLGNLRLHVPPAPEVAIAPRTPCVLELEDGRRLRLSFDDTRLLAPEQDARGPWITLERSPLAEAVLETPPTPHTFLALVGVALVAGERVVVVGDLLEQAFVEGTGGPREAPRVVPTGLRARFVAADQPGSLAQLEVELKRFGVTAIDG